MVEAELGEGASFAEREKAALAAWDKALADINENTKDPKRIREARRSIGFLLASKEGTDGERASRTGK